MKLLALLFFITSPLISSAQVLEFSCQFASITKNCGEGYKWDCYEISNCTFFDRADRSKYVKNKTTFDDKKPYSFYLASNARVYCGGKLNKIQKCKVGNIISFKESFPTRFTRIHLDKDLNIDQAREADIWFFWHKERNP